ncbi:Phenylalanine--tRNA ligase beta subunit [Aquisphaera giovannonii]|uniref:Phenylalanine--tRNA ligase beta subunit n=1 Tax=Aquisphaera giovannonii TaxID=406548 RepID=A0A5B9VYQ0_9BACT|nr:phenylalanine--tRNA ligase subunit beta [Aquisphaera giovannonii]QEH32865.1 Phenylalanine--tRNA ligase beta subunit [Aquisphaera giovannonii]
MIVSWNWLTDYVRLDMPVEALAERLALTGLNHESTEDVGGDLAIDLEVTSNRSDCLGHIGIAREIGVVFGKALKVPDPRPRGAAPAASSRAAVAVECPELCSRFTARVVTGARVGESPWWLRKRLETIGVTPISNVVDVTNYVMFECGQPLHAYDLGLLREGRLVVRRARPGESLKAINGKTYELKPEMLVIADAERPVGLAGVMGGLETEIGEGTQDILIEAARFDAMSVRKTSRALGLFSPSSFRFERPIDPEITEWASRRCAELILATAGGTLHEGLIDMGGPSVPRGPITLRYAQIERVLGIAVGAEEVRRILAALGLEVLAQDGATITARPPTWRPDLEREIDLIEEVARIHGYEHIPEDRAVPMTSAPRGLRERVESAVREALTGVGMDESVTFSLVEESLAAPVQTGTAAPPLRIDHSSRKLEIALRQSLLPSLLAARAYNESRGNLGAELFEIANVYLPRGAGELPDEPTRLGLVSGRDFRGLKGIVEALLDRLHIAGPLEALPADLPLFAPGRAAELRAGDVHLGYMGELEKGRLQAFDLREACTAAELELGILLERAVLVGQHRPLPAFPAIVRDLSLVVDRTLSWADLRAAAVEAGGPSLISVEYLDTFRGGNLPEDRQSVHFGLTFRDPSRTLTGEEVDRAVKSVADACARRLGAVLRT